MSWDPISKDKFREYEPEVWDLPDDDNDINDRMSIASIHHDYERHGTPMYHAFNNLMSAINNPHETFTSNRIITSVSPRSPRYDAWRLRIYQRTCAVAYDIINENMLMLINRSKMLELSDGTIKSYELSASNIQLINPFIKMIKYAMDITPVYVRCHTKDALFYKYILSDEMNVAADHFIKFLTTISNDIGFKVYKDKLVNKSSYIIQTTYSMRDRLPTVLHYLNDCFTGRIISTPSFDWVYDCARDVMDMAFDAYCNNDFTEFYQKYHLTDNDIRYLYTYFALLCQYGDKPKSLIEQYYRNMNKTGDVIEIFNIDHINAIIQHFSDPIQSTYCGLANCFYHPYDRSMDLSEFRKQTRMFQIVFDQMLVQNEQRVFNKTLETEYAFRLRVSSGADSRYHPSATSGVMNVIMNYSQMLSAKILTGFVHHYCNVELHRVKYDGMLNITNRK